MAEVPREAFRQMLTVLSTKSYQELPLSERGSWLPNDVREAIRQGWVEADGTEAGVFGTPVQITALGRAALQSMPYPPHRG